MDRAEEAEMEEEQHDVGDDAHEQDGEGEQGTSDPEAPFGERVRGVLAAVHTTLRSRTLHGQLEREGEGLAAHAGMGAGPSA